MPLSAILFDLDGTLLDTARDFQTALNQLLLAEGRSPIEEGSIRTYVTDGSAGIIRAALGIEQNDPDFARLQQILLANYCSCLTEKTKIFPGLESSFELLKRHEIPWGIVTNKPLQYTQPIVDALAPECAVLICPEHVTATKPDPEGLYKAAKFLSVEPSACLYVGDHRRDIEAANAAGMVSVAANWGYIDHRYENTKKWCANHIIDKPAELAALLNQYL